MKRPSKYGNRKVEVDGVTFHSAHEARRYGQLKLLVKAGEIADLELQPRYDFALNGVKIGFYKADFRFREVATGERVVEDAKGFKTDVYNLKKKMLKAFHGIDVVEV
ncbi:MAG: DUF1064 domain-containing protein [Pseudomonadota bacterium]